MELIVSICSLDNEITYNPENNIAKLFISLIIKQHRFTNRDIEIIKKLGFQVSVKRTQLTNSYYL